LIWGITTGCLSYAPKGKLLAGVCLIIIGTEGFDSVAQLETNAVKVMADAEYRTVKEVGKLGCSGRGSRSDLDARLV
jgi:hypothetical protein